MLTYLYLEEQGCVTKLQESFSSEWHRLKGFLQKLPECLQQLLEEIGYALCLIKHIPTYMFTLKARAVPKFTLLDCDLWDLYRVKLHQTSGNILVFWGVPLSAARGNPLQLGWVQAGLSWCWTVAKGCTLLSLTNGQQLKESIINMLINMFLTCSLAAEL